MKTTFIYCLREPDTGAIRYVGKSDNPKKRFSEHFRSKERCHRTNWFKSLVERGLKPILEVIDEVPEVYWQQLEIAYVEFFHESGCNLVNGNAGGKGGHSPNDETRAKKRAASLGTKNAMFGKTGVASPTFGRKLSSEERKTVGIAQRNIKERRNTSGFVGVSWHASNSFWRAEFTGSTKRIYLSGFKNIEDAVFVRALAVDKYFSKSS